MELDQFRQMHRGHLRARFKQRDKYEWPSVEVTTYSDPFDPAVLGVFLAGMFIGEEPWIVEGYLRADPAGPPIVSRLTVEHHPAHREVTGTVLRALPIAKIRDRALGKMFPLAASRRIAVELDVVSEADVLQAEQAATEATKPRPGRRAKPEQHYERIAQRYLELLGEGRRDVLKVLAAEESEREGRVVPRETIRDWVRKATRLEFLAPGTPGRAEARPGPRLNRKPKRRRK